ncbi:amidase family protein [Gordonia sp. OPL2]|uniref:amidase family protein n=1 Tax=Gordonia sp. OPL2 TaxID=2486274 RepID=UPI0016559247|nr:amidase family protein [Gordonia sp. OPL2]RPA06179.1 FCD domain-containing protein [Gordonia sp. OPL2]
MAPTVGESVYQEIRRKILDGRITPGTRVTIRSLAQSLGVSTMPTREALKRLHVEGLVEFDRRAVTVTSLSAREIRQLFAIRLTLESQATEWALPRLDHESTVTMRKILDQMSSADITTQEWRELNRAFHQTFYDCADSRYLGELIRNTWDRVQPYMAIYANVAHTLDEARRQHEHMFGLMRDGKLDELLDATRHHLEHTADAIVGALDDGLGSDKEQHVNYAELTIDDLHRMIRSGETTSAAVTSWYLSRIDDIDSVDNPAGLQINSVVTVNDAALREAAYLDEIHAKTGELVGPLHGVPILVKDQGETAGIPTAFGSTVFADYVPEADATVVERLREAGAVILGKTTMCDFAAGWFSFSSRSDHTKNPYDLGRETGGSSAGTAAAVTANLCLVGIGEDTGGSIRLPSSFTNLFGLRVTTGLIPRTGFSPLLHFQDTPGPMARTVTDLAHVLDTVVGYDPSDAYTGIATANPDVGDYRAALHDVASSSLASYRVGVLADAFGQGADQGQTNTVVRSAIEELAACGATIVDELHLGDLQNWIRETSLYSLRSKQDIDAFLRDRPTAPASSVKEIVAAGAFHPLTDLMQDIGDAPDDVDDNPDYLRGRVRQEEWRRTLVSMMAAADVDFLVYPTVQVPPPTRDDLAAKRWTALDFPTNTVIASQTSLPAMTIPVGFTDTELPIGMEVLGRQFSERALLRFARAWELHANPRRLAVSTLLAEG